MFHGTVMKSKSCNKNYTALSVLISILLFTGIVACAQPVAKFSANTLSGCAPILVQFTDGSAGNPTQWKWDLGNGTISYLQHPSVTYFNPGLYSVKLIVKNTSGEDSLVKTNYVTVYAAPSINFIASQTTGCNMVAANFTDQTNAGSGSINSWQWDFGDGILSSTQSPVHAYLQIGNYNISLKVGNSNGCVATLLQKAYIKVNGVKANFNNIVSARCTPSKIIFKNISTGNGSIRYKWFFGNGDSSILESPVYTYATGGNYTVKLLVSNEHGCVDSMIKNILVINPVSAAFTSDITTACKAPATVKFTNQVLSGNTYQWSFGDTLASTASNPSHVFQDTGTYTVKLIVRNNGCVDSVKKTGYIKIQKPFVVFDNLPDSGCSSFTKNITVVVNGSDKVVNYLWDFGDGANSNSISPTHTFTSSGYHTVSLVTTDAVGCRDTSSMTDAIRVNNKPLAKFSADIKYACAQTKIKFTDLSTGGATQWEWDFGDNTQSDEQHPEHIFKDTGFMTVQLIVFNGGCADTVKMEKYIYVKPAVAKFNFNFTCAAPFTYSFKNFSIGADQWVWDFGDGNTSTELNPIHNYSDTGAYSVSLIAFNHTTGCNYYHSKPVRVIKIQPNFFASDTSICKGSEINFTATLKSTEAVRFLWDFGDGNNVFTRQNTVAHIYEQAGNYSVRLITINLINCRDTVVKSMYIRVNGPAANFGTAVTGACINNIIAFSDSSLTDGTNAIQSWQWNYGDGNNETLYAPPFTHVYKYRGNYFVALKVTDSKGCSDSFKLTSPLVIKKLTNYFLCYDTLSCTNKAVGFVAPYAEVGVTYRWDFGDGGTASIQSPRHIYNAEGMYTVKFYITHQFGCADSSTQVNVVSIQDPVAKFTMSDSFKTCPPLIIQFTNQSLNAADEIWDFGDGSSTSIHNPSHFYSYPGTYTARLTVNGRGGCSRQMQKQIVVKGPKGTLSFNPLNFCKSQQANFVAHTVDAVSYIWDFNDGSTSINTDSFATHNYNNTGKYAPKVILADGAGCKVPINSSDSINIVNLSAKFNFPDNFFCNGDTISFTDNTITSEAVAEYRWDFGDGNFAGSIANPQHQYQLQGEFYPVLKVTTISGCVDSFAASAPVKVLAIPAINLQSTANGCTPLLTTFSGKLDTPEGPIIKWGWDFGNGNTSVLQNPPAQNYTAADNYIVTLLATNNQGCTKSINKTIVAYASPPLHIDGDSIICKGKNTTLVATGADNYSWQPAAGLSCTNCASPLVTADSTTTYVVVAAAVNGCKAKDSVVVKVATVFKMNYSNAAKVCAGQSVKLYTSGAGVYEWWPASGLDKINSSTPQAQPASTTTYRIIGADAKGCFKDTGYVLVNVNALPTVNAGDDKKINSGSPVDLIPIISADVTEVNWSPTGNIFRNSGNAITVKPFTNTEYTVQVKNAAGCTASDKVNVTIINTSTDVFIPNTFSPNADGANDIFYPRSAGSIKIRRLKIFNRDGITVYEKINFYTNDAASGWNGNYKGAVLAAGIYIYAIEIIGSSGKPTVVTGNVALLQ